MDEFSGRYLNDIEIEISRAESAAYQSLVDLYKAQVGIRQAASEQDAAIGRYKQAVDKLKAFTELPGLTEQAKARLKAASEYAEDAITTLTRLWREEAQSLLEAARNVLADDTDRPPAEPKY